MRRAGSGRGAGATGAGDDVGEKEVVAEEVVVAGVAGVVVSNRAAKLQQLQQARLEQVWL